VGLEIAREAVSRGIAIDEVLAPCGGGGLVSGIALAFSGTSPSTKVIAVEPQDYNGMGRSLAAGVRTAAPAQTPSIADALMAPMPGEIPFAVAKHHLARALVVSDREMVNAVDFAVRRLKIMAEPGGAAGLAALLAGKIECRNKTVAVVISGGNGDPETILAYCSAAASH
jgi:threonine dehydratase